ncbi:unnamed protein product [Absidia cylindrospora]
MQVKNILKTRQITSPYFTPASHRSPSKSDMNHPVSPLRRTDDIPRMLSSYRYQRPSSGSMSLAPSPSGKVTPQSFVISDQDSDGTDDSDDDDDDDLDNYVGHTTHQNSILNSSSLEDKIAMLRERFPSMARSILLKALEDNNGQFTAASMQLLDTSKSTRPSSSAQLSSAKRMRTNGGRQRRSRITSSSDSDSEEDQRPKTLHWKDRQELLEAVQTVNFYNTARCQDIMDVTGCKSTSAEKLITLRPFETLQDLHDKLKMERGLSVQYIKAYMELMEGYSAVDQIIQNIEHTGTQLQNILDVWQQFTSATTPAPLDGDDDDTGMHLVEMDNMKADGDNDGGGAIKGLDTSSHAYKDAMDGFLTLQPAIVNPAFNLKAYQTIGVNWMLLLYRKGISGILADEMGLGKTAQVISFLGRLYELGETGPHLVIVPASTMDNWLREFKRFCPTLNVRCYYGTQSERMELQDEINDDLGNINVVVTTYSMASGSVDDRSFLRRLRCKSMILDEGHMIKNYASSRYGHLMRLNAPFRLLLTGTPLQNNLQELVSLLIFIMPNVFSGNEEDIRKIFKLKTQCSSGGDDQQTTTTTTESSTAKAAQMLSRQRIERAKKMMTPFVLRRRKAHVLAHLPQKIHHVQYCTMTPNQHALYSKLVMDSRQRFKEETPLDSSNTKKKVEKFSNLVMHLRKAADHPLLFRRIYDDDTIKQMAKEIMKEERYLDANEQYIYEDMEVMSDFELNVLCRDFETLRHRMLKNEEWMDAGKIQYLQQLLPRMKENGSKVLLFSQFTSMLDIMELVMGTLGLSFIRLDGSTKVGERQSLIDEFNQNESLDVFLLSTKAGGFGINLASAK